MKRPRGHSPESNRDPVQLLKEYRQYVEFGPNNTLYIKDQERLKNCAAELQHLSHMEPYCKTFRMVCDLLAHVDTPEYVNYYGMLVKVKTGFPPSKPAPAIKRATSYTRKKTAALLAKPTLAQKNRAINRSKKDNGIVSVKPEPTAQIAPVIRKGKRESAIDDRSIFEIIEQMGMTGVNEIKGKMHTTNNNLATELHALCTRLEQVDDPATLPEGAMPRPIIERFEALRNELNDLCERYGISARLVSTIEVMVRVQNRP